MPFTVGANIPAVGSRTHFGFGKEQQYGQISQRVSFLRVLSVGLERASEPIDSEAISGRSQFRSAKAQVEAGGSVDVEYQYQGMELLFYALMGSVTSNVVADDGGTPPTPTAWEHIFTMDDLLNVSLTLEKHADLETYIYGGSKVNSASWSIEPNSFITGTFEFFSREEDIAGLTASDGLGNPATDPQYQTSTPVFPPDLPMHFTDITKASIGIPGQDPNTFVPTFFQIKGLNFTINNNLDRRFFLGSQYSKNPLPTSKIEVTGTLNMELEPDSIDLYRKFRNKEEVSLVVEFTGPDIANTNPPTKFKFMVYFPRVQFLGSSPTIDSIGPVNIDLDFKALAFSDTQREVEIRLTNDTDPAIFI